LKNRVVVTGMGVISPIGNSCSEFSESLQIGRNGISYINSFDTEKFSVKIAGEVNINLDDLIDKKEQNRIDRFTAFTIFASHEAINNSNILNSPVNKDRVGVIIGSGIGGISTFETQHKRLLKNPKLVSPFFIPSMISDIAAGVISMKYGFKGHNYSVVSACATGSHSIGDAFRIIQNGELDVAIAGASEATISPMAIAGFTNMKALSKNHNPKNASKPFDKNRDGFVMGEGSGILVIESLNHALNRDANIIAEITGYAATADAYHLTSPSPNGEGATRAMKLALLDSKISPKDIDYINAHGTSTPTNDRIETVAIKNVFNKFLNKINISSTKSMTGHLLGASGSIEAIASILSINENFIPPTINYSTFDPECDLNYTPNKTLYEKVNYAMSNSFGFGGHNAVLIFKGYES
jgi:3-oxoacyl-[acyl-carrier-protein] synthase II